MTGNDNHSATGADAPPMRATATAPADWFARLTHTLTHAQARYLAVDGGAGAQVFAALAGRSPHLRAVATPRHADLLIVVGPISQRLAPAVAELARALPHPAHALALDLPDASAGFAFPGQVAIERILPNIMRIPATPDAALAAALHPDALPNLTVSDAFTLEPHEIALPPSGEREIATELAVLSLGPLQPFTAGPLRLWLVCDGEQVLSCLVEAGYAARGVAEAMLGAGWRAGVELARQLDPLAPIVGQLAYTQALEQLQHMQITPPVFHARFAALAIERAVNHLWWATNFFRLLDEPRLVERAYALAQTLAALTPRLWPEPPARWIVPQGAAPQPDTATLAEITRLAETVETFARRVRSNRLLRLRAAGIGRLTQQRLIAAHVSGPAVFASVRSGDDVRGRLLARLELAAAGLGSAAHIVAANPGASGEPGASVAPSERAPRWDAPAGEASATVDGPRGKLGVRLVSDGGERPTLVEWQRPSAALLPLLPELLAGQKLADAEIIVASLDLAMAEADG